MRGGNTLAIELFELGTVSSDVFTKIGRQNDYRSNISINEIFYCVRRSCLLIKRIRICSNVGTVVIWK